MAAETLMDSLDILVLYMKTCSADGEQIKWQGNMLNSEIIIPSLVDIRKSSFSQEELIDMLSVGFTIELCIHKVCTPYFRQDRFEGLIVSGLSVNKRDTSGCLEERLASCSCCS